MSVEGLVLRVQGLRLRVEGFKFRRSCWARRRLAKFEAKGLWFSVVSVNGVNWFYGANGFWRFRV